MNDHIDPGLIAKVKEWAKVRGQGQGTPLHLGDAVAEFITAMPDQMIDADKVREQAKLHRKWAEADSGMPGMKNTHTYIAEVLESLLPTPPLSTLKDLIEEGHDPAQYQWMQAEHEGERCVIVSAYVTSLTPTTRLLTTDGALLWIGAEEVVPLPDLPRMVWPDEFHPEPAEDFSTPEVAPKVLTTEEDYRDAPYGTVVRSEGLVVNEKTFADTWHAVGTKNSVSNSDMAGPRRTVIYMPWGQS